MNTIGVIRKNKETIKELESYGIVSTCWLRNLQIYEDYKKLSNICQMCKYEILAEKHKIDSNTVRNIIAKMKK